MYIFCTVIYYIFSGNTGGVNFYFVKGVTGNKYSTGEGNKMKMMKRTISETVT